MARPPEISSTVAMELAEGGRVVEYRIVEQQPEPNARRSPGGYCEPASCMTRA